MSNMSQDLLKESLLALYREVLTNSWDITHHRPPEHILKIYPELHEQIDAYEKEDATFRQRVNQTRMFAKRRVFNCHFDASVRSEEPVSAGGGLVIRGVGEEILNKVKFPIMPYVGVGGVSSNTLAEGLEPISSHIAEYHAMNASLRSLLSSISDPSLVRLNLYTDSMNLKNQMEGFSRVRNPIIQELIQEARHLMSLFEQVRLVRIPRNENFLADRLAQEAMQESSHELS